MALSKNIIIGIAIAIIASVVFFGNSGNNSSALLSSSSPVPSSSNSPASSPQEKTIRKSGEMPFSELAKLSGCALPADSDTSAAKYDDFAKCLAEKNVKMYGAYWCGHCQNQKKAFGESFQYVNYIECADPNSNKQLDICAKEGITGYPTWEFPEKVG